MSYKATGYITPQIGSLYRLYNCLCQKAIKMIPKQAITLPPSALGFRRCIPIFSIDTCIKLRIVHTASFEHLTLDLFQMKIEMNDRIVEQLLNGHEIIKVGIPAGWIIHPAFPFIIFD